MPGCSWLWWVGHWWPTVPVLQLAVVGGPLVAHWWPPLQLAVVGGPLVAHRWQCDLTTHIHRWPTGGVLSGICILYFIIYFILYGTVALHTVSKSSSTVCTAIGCHFMDGFHTWTPSGGNIAAKTHSALISVRSTSVLLTEIYNSRRMNQRSQG